MSYETRMLLAGYAKAALLSAMRDNTHNIVLPRTIYKWTSYGRWHTKKTNRSIRFAVDWIPLAAIPRLEVNTPGLWKWFLTPGWLTLVASLGSVLHAGHFVLGGQRMRQGWYLSLVEQCHKGGLEFRTITKMVRSGP